MLSYTGVKQSTSTSGSQSSGNTKKDKIWQTPSITLKNKVEAHPRTVKSSLKNKIVLLNLKELQMCRHSVQLKCASKPLCVKCNGCMLFDNHDLCVLDFIKNVNARVKSKSVKKSSKRKVWKPTGKVFTNIRYTWRPTGRTFTIVGNACPLTRITTTTEVPLRKPTALENETPKPVVTLVYLRKPRKSKTNVPDSKSKVSKSVSANKKEPSQSWGSKVSNVPSSSLNECRSSKLFSEVDTQLNQEIFQRDNSVSNQSAPSFDQLFELNELKAQSQEKDTVIKKLKERIKSLSGKMNEDKIKKDLKEIVTINIELDHRVSKLIAENEHLKQTYKQLYDSIKPARIRSKEQCDDLINQVNIKSVEISNLNARLQEKVLVITALKNDLRKLKGKDLADNVVTKYTIDPEMLKIDVEYLNPKLLNNRSAHSDYLKHTQEEAAILREIELLVIIGQTCPSFNKASEKLVAVTPKNKDKRVRVKPSTSASGSQPSGNTNKDKIRQTPSSIQKNKVEAHPRKVKSSLKNKCCVIPPKGTAHVQHPNLNANRPTGRTFTIVENACPLTRITKTTEIPLRKPTALENETPKPVVTLGYSRKPRKSKTNVPISKSKVVQIVLWYLDFGCSKHNFVNKFLGTVKFGNDHVAKILGYGDYQIANVTILRVYYVEGLGHNLFSVRQFYDSNLEVAFRQHTCFIPNLEGVDQLTGSRGNNLYTLSLRDMMASSPICLLSNASKTKSWLWHRRLSHLNFGAINHLARHGHVRGLPKLKFEKDHLCSACAMGKIKKKPHTPKSEDTNQEKLYLLHMDLCGPMRVAS
ncbi:retrovirus-related pol polyprotein from transposon TNT 1-94, partial [Tanacetum coccineum]